MLPICGISRLPLCLSPDSASHTRHSTPKEPESKSRPPCQSVILLHSRYRPNLTHMIHLKRHFIFITNHLIHPITRRSFPLGFPFPFSFTSLALGITRYQLPRRSEPHSISLYSSFKCLFRLCVVRRNEFVECPFDVVCWRGLGLEFGGVTYEEELFEGSRGKL